MSTQTEERTEYDTLQDIGIRLTQLVALAELRRDWDKVDELIREKDRINRQLREAKCQQT